MSFQKTHVSIVRSIRQVSLLRDWQRTRGSRNLPDISDFIPDERAGDAADILMTEIRLVDGGPGYLCRSAGERVEQLFNERMPGRLLHECLDRPMADASRPIWDACIRHMLPIYCIVPLSDANGCPVTVEQIFLPYGGPAAAGPAYMLGALHAWSTEGRFAAQGLLRNVAKAPLHWSVIIDPTLKRMTPSPEAVGLDEIEFNNTLASPPAR
jgi:hypothetical protein